MPRAGARKCRAAVSHGDECQLWAGHEGGHEGINKPDADYGHTFRFEISSRGSYGVTGEAHHTDVDYWDAYNTVEVRAWSLKEAIGMVAALPLADFMIGEEP